jgi:hypothetical protein
VAIYDDAESPVETSFWIEGAFDPSATFSAKS